MITLNLHSVKWRVDLRVDPPRIWKWDPVCGWDEWKCGASLDQRRLRLQARLLERARAIAL